nr:MAG TPA: hypothetical protein [Caudoviricetes sp.]
MPGRRNHKLVDTGRNSMVNDTKRIYCSKKRRWYPGNDHYK